MRADRSLSPLTTEQVVALKKYAAEHGRRWKRALSVDWMYARLTGPLHALRNTHGPSWLVDFRFDTSRCDVCYLPKNHGGAHDLVSENFLPASPRSEA